MLASELLIEDLNVLPIKSNSSRFLGVHAGEGLRNGRFSRPITILSGIGTAGREGYVEVTSIISPRG